MGMDFDGDFEENFDTISDDGLGQIISALKQADTEHLIFGLRL